MMTAFENLRFGSAPSVAPPVPPGTSFGKVIARGTSAGIRWDVSASENKGAVSLRVDLPGQAIGVGVPRGPKGQVPVLSPESVPLGAGPGSRLLVFGFVSHGVSSVHMEPTHEIGKLYPIPGHRGLMAFVVVAARSQKAIVVAEDEGGKILAQAPARLPTPHPRASRLTGGPPKASLSP